MSRENSVDQLKTMVIPLTQGKVTIVDSADYEMLTRHPWHACKSSTLWYAIRSTKVNGKAVRIRMHRLLMGNPLPGIEIDHINGNSLDNRRCNLCLVTRKEHNQKRLKSRGLHFHSKRKKWNVSISLGVFTDRVEAVAQYKLAWQVLTDAGIDVGPPFREE